MKWKLVIVKRLIHIYFKLRNSRFGWWFLNRKYKYEGKGVKELKRTGIYVASLSELGFDLKDFKYEIKGDVKSNKPFLTYLWDKSPVVEDNAFFRSALNEKVLDIVNSYMGIRSKLYYATLNLTKPSEGLVGSQNWHRDEGDRKILKVFIYLTDVDEDSGPFMYVKESVKGLKYGKLYPQYAPEGNYPTGQIPDYSVMTGKAGTVIFCDTTGLHRGGKGTKERVMFTAAYYAPSSISLVPKLKGGTTFETTYNKYDFSRRLAKKYFSL